LGNHKNGIDGVVRVLAHATSRAYDYLWVHDYEGALNVLKGSLSDIEGMIKGMLGVDEIESMKGKRKTSRRIEYIINVIQSKNKDDAETIILASILSKIKRIIESLESIVECGKVVEQGGRHVEYTIDDTDVRVILFVLGCIDYNVFVIRGLLSHRLIVEEPENTRKRIGESVAQSLGDVQVSVIPSPRHGLVVDVWARNYYYRLTIFDNRLHLLVHTSAPQEETLEKAKELINTVVRTLARSSKLVKGYV